MDNKFIETPGSVQEEELSRDERLMQFKQEIEDINRNILHPLRERRNEKGEEIRHLLKSLFTDHTRKIKKLEGEIEDIRKEMEGPERERTRIEGEMNKIYTEMAEIDFSKEKDKRLEFLNGKMEEFSAVHKRYTESRDELDNQINSKIKDYLDLGMARNVAINTYRQENQNTYLDTHLLEEFKEVIGRIEEVLLELEITVEKIEGVQFENDYSKRALYGGQIDYLINHEYTNMLIQKMDSYLDRLKV